MKGWMRWGSAAVLMGMAIAGEISLAAHRPVAVPALQESAFAAFGGLRSIAAEVVWFRADRLQENGRYVELAQLARTLTLMEPHTPEVWSYAAWNLGYNISVMMATFEDRWRWVLASIELLRDDGLRLNPDSAELYRELAWTFQLKLGANIDSAAPLYREKWREIVRDVERRGAWEELGMTRERMDEVERAYGIVERGHPQYSALYWAHFGLKRAETKNERIFLMEIIRQAQAIYLRTRGA